MLVSTQPDAPVCAKLGDFGLASRLFLNSLQYKLKDFPVDNATWYLPLPFPHLLSLFSSL